jgi:putative FmdB family regulatory protein
MPIYEYICEKCGNEFELLVFRDEEPLCPACGEKNPVKKMSSFGFSAGHGFKSSSTGGGSGCASCGSSNCSTCH